MDDKLKIKEVIVVEGRYDAHAVRACVDATVIELSGFGIFRNKKQTELLSALAVKNGLIVLTDSDGAGFVIRNRLKGGIDGRYLKHAYIPAIPGRERRKKHAGQSKILGVEAMDRETIIKAILNAGATVLGSRENRPELRPVTKADMYEDGLFGKKDAASLRRALARELGFPEMLSVNALAGAVNAVCGYERYKEAVIKIKAGLI